MSLLRKLKFVFKYEIEPEFIVIPFGDEYNPARFLKYEDALRFTDKCIYDMPQYGRPSILVVVHRNERKFKTPSKR